MIRNLLMTLLVSCSVYGGSAMGLNLSANFDPNDPIPQEYTCEGKDTSPLLNLSAIPNGTQSLVLILEDPDAPSGIWTHWVLYNIPATTKQLTSSALPKGTIPGKNSWGKMEYRGPCPPDGEHRYIFTVYALNTSLNLPAGADAVAVQQAIKHHVLEQAQLMGKYKKQSSQ